MSLKIVPVTNQRLVSAAGTPERLYEAAQGFGGKVISVIIKALATNAGNIHVGNSPVNALNTNAYSFILAAGEILTLDVHDFADGYLDLTDIWIDAANNDDGVCITYFEVIN